MVVFNKELEARVNELIVQHCENQKKLGVPLSISFLVGACLENEHYILLALPCPHPETTVSDPEVIGTGSRNVKKRDGLDGEWVRDQCALLLPTLPGGLSVCGLLMMGDKSALNTQHAAFMKTLKNLNRDALQCSFGFGPSIGESMLMVRLESPNARPSAIILDVRTGSSSNGSISYQSLNWIRLQSRVQLNHRIYPRRKEDASSGKGSEITLEDTFFNNSSHFLNSILQSSCLFNGRTAYLMDKIQQKTSKKSKGGKKGGGEGGGDEEISELEVDVLAKLGNSVDDLAEVYQGDDELRLDGHIHVMGYVPARAACYTDAADAVKEDILRTILTRIRLASQEAQLVDHDGNLAFNNQTVFHLPKRVAINCDYVRLCDYQFDEDTAEDVVENLKPFLGDQITVDQIIEVGETHSNITRIPTNILKNVTKREDNSSKTESPSTVSQQSSSMSPQLLYGLAAVLVAIIAALVYLLLNSA